MHEMTFDFEGLIRMIANNLYSEKKVFIRELIQNAHDGIRRRAAEHGVVGRIDVETRPQDLEITVRDNGMGMDHDDLVHYLSNIGRSLTREGTEEDETLIGQFGIGFLSAFVVASRVRVMTRKVGDSAGWLWENEGNKEYTLQECEVPAAGTTVTVSLAGPEDRGMIQEAEVRKLIRRYADMLTVPIHLNGSPEPENTMHMPWERGGLTSWELQDDLTFYVERTLNDRVLEVIPVQLRGPVHADGVLYITRDRLYNVDQPRTIRLFQRRMFLCEDQQDVLPQWARFVNGVINTRDLTPTAARDNFLRDDNWAALRDALGDLVIKHLAHLRDTDRPRFASIARYHRMSFAAASYYYDTFFAKFADLLLWRTNQLPGEASPGVSLDALADANSGEVLRTLPEILAEGRRRGPQSAGPQILQCITGVDAARQYFAIANAADTLVVDASFAFEPELLDAYTRLPGKALQLVHVDREDAPSGGVIFRPPAGDASVDVERLAERMSVILHTPFNQAIRTEARAFDPRTIAAVLRTDARTEAQRKAEEVLLDPNAQPGVREMAEAVSRMTLGAGQRLTINAANPLVQRLAALQDSADEEVQQLMLALYHSAALANGQMITAQAAQAFHDQLQRLMGRSLEALELDARRRGLEEQLRLLKDRNRTDTRPTHPTIFMITPFADRYAPLVAACRRALERRGCELVVASDRHEDLRLLENVRVLMDGASGFIAEVTEANPNVMFELGAALADRRDRPVLLLRENGLAVNGTLPADLRGLLYLTYDSGDTELAQHLGDAMARTSAMQDLLEDESRLHFVSPETIAERLGAVILPDEKLSALARRFPTAEAWQAAEVEDVARILGAEHEDLAPYVLRKMNGPAVAQ